MIALKARREVPTEVDFEPIATVEVELAEPLADLDPGRTPGGAAYPLALAFVRLHGAPVGLVKLRLDGGRLGAAALATALWPEVRDAVERHLAADGLGPAGTLTPVGLGSEGTPRCLSERESFLQDPPPLTVLIPSRERAERLRRCLESIFASRYPAERLTVLVVDNAPRTDGTRELVEELAAAGRPIVYAREDAPGSASARNRGLAVVETDLVAMTDDEVAEQIRRDEIDILVDLAAHTARNRLPVFARKPAGVQVTYLAYCSTTGLKTMDYRLSDFFLDPEGTERVGDGFLAGRALP